MYPVDPQKEILRQLIAQRQQSAGMQYPEPQGLPQEMLPPQVADPNGVFPQAPQMIEPGQQVEYSPGPSSPDAANQQGLQNPQKQMLKMLIQKRMQEQLPQDAK